MLRKGQDEEDWTKCVLNVAVVLLTEIPVCSSS